VKASVLSLRGAKVLLGVTGGIAAYKSAYLVRQLAKAGAQTRVVMTRSACEFVTPLTFSALSMAPVAVDLWSKDQSTDSKVGTKHIDLAKWCDVMLIAPASANTIAKVAHGYADNLLTILALACRKPVVLAPTMDADMFVNETTQRNISTLYERGFEIIPPDEGEHASGLTGPGRLPEVETLVLALSKTLSGGLQDLKGRRFVVTAGPTQEPIDPVRYIGNRSSGKMGFAVAREAARRGARVTLISGPVVRETPRHVSRIDVSTAAEMLAAVRKELKSADVLVMTAAVADFVPAEPAQGKLKKSSDTMVLHLTPAPDILDALTKAGKKNLLRVGFALETEEGLRNARQKLSKKNLDVIVLNEFTTSNRVFGSDKNRVTIIDRSGASVALPVLEKTEVARRLIDKIKGMM